jgi:RNA polymerase sigma-70 factor (ECF subfamily)
MALPRAQVASNPAEAEALALVSLVHAHAATLYRVSYSVMRDAAEAEDIVQDTFVRVLEHRKRLPEVRDLRVWLIRIAWNLALDRRRRNQPEPADDALLARLVARDQPADAALEDTLRLRAVLAAMDGLPKLERQALLLASVEELSTAEIAAVLERSESAVRALLFRARTRLKERLKKGGYA